MLFLVLGCLLAAGGGAFAYVGMNPPPAPPQPQVSVAHMGPGLPELRPEEKIAASNGKATSPNVITVKPAGASLAKARGKK